MDVQTAVMTLSLHRSAPRDGCLSRFKRAYSYISKMKYTTIRIGVEEPDFLEFPDDPYIWGHHIYDEVNKEIPRDILKPL